MALSLFYCYIISNFLIAFFIRHVEAATVTYNFNITWVTANPDGQFERTTIGINGAWPLPIIEASVGDTVIVNVDNQLGNQTTSLHFHGLYMQNATHMDGPAMVTQCPIPAGSQFTYEFVVNQPGTYWYHSHDKGQYPDGLRAPFIVHDPENPFTDLYDEEIVLSLSDWYHEQMQTLIPKFLAKTNPKGAEPVPQNALLNDTQNLTVSVQPGRTYLFRVVNIGAFAGQYLWFEGHNISIVEVDGVYHEPAEAQAVYLSAAQRCSFLLTTKNETDTNYAFVGSMDSGLFDTIPDGLNWNVTGWLVYDSAAPLPEPAIVDEFNDFDDFTLVPFDKQELLPEPDQTITLDVIMGNLGDGKPYAFFNNITYTPQKVPTLYTALTSGENALNPVIYGEFSHPFVLRKDEIVDIVVNNQDTGKHPFHLHGHNFQAIARSDKDSGDFNASDPSQTNFPAIPMRRDTFVIRPTGHIILRFRASNPGIWLFHCHIEWHVDQGLVATMVEAPDELQKLVTIPQGHLDVCTQAGIATSGNAAGNSENFLDLRGAPRAHDPLPSGFTARGIVALTFSCVSALLGLAVIAWYGMADMGEASMAAEKRRIAELERTVVHEQSSVGNKVTATTGVAAVR